MPRDGSGSVPKISSGGLECVRATKLWILAATKDGLLYRQRALSDHAGPFMRLTKIKRC